MFEQPEVERLIAALKRKLDGVQDRADPKARGMVQALEEAIMGLEAGRAPRRFFARQRDPGAR